VFAGGVAVLNRRGSAGGVFFLCTMPIVKPPKW